MKKANQSLLIIILLFVVSIWGYLLVDIFDNQPQKTIIKTDKQGQEYNKMIAESLQETKTLHLQTPSSSVEIKEVK